MEMVFESVEFAGLFVLRMEMEPKRVSFAVVELFFATWRLRLGYAASAVTFFWFYVSMYIAASIFV